MYEKKLSLKKEMDRSHLIQRLRKPSGKPSISAFGGGLVNGGLSDKAMNLLNGIFSFDYMGAAEFEWGAVPVALSFIAEQAGKGKLVVGQHRNVFYICPVSYEAGVKGVINSLLDDEHSLRLKEYCGLETALNPRIDRKAYPNNNVGWLELDNGFFLFSDSEMYENVKHLFGVK